MKKFIILIPLYNDWKSVTKLLNEIDKQVNVWDAELSVIIVNDASTEERPVITSNYKKGCSKSITSISGSLVLLESREQVCHLKISMRL